MSQRLVVKIGSSSLTSEEGELNERKVNYYVQELVKLQQAGHQLLLVTSGAVAAGFRKVGYAKRPVHIHEKQAAAAVGQTLLMQAYSEAFSDHGKLVAQVLLTRSDFSNRQRVHNALNTIEELLKHQILPIINENDTVAINELKFGDNDTLSAMVANLVKAKQLIIITDTDGLYTADPRTNLTAKKIQYVEKIDDQIFEIAGKDGGAMGTGGMRSKVEAARIAVRGGISVFVGEVSDNDDLQLAVSGQGKGTYFETHLQSMPMKKQWVGIHAIPTGKVIVDAGAEQALMLMGKSLLPAGVTKVEGEFHPGDVIEVMNEEMRIIGRGVTNYAAWQLQAVAGLSTKEVQKRVEVQRIEVIHRDEWTTLHE